MSRSREVAAPRLPCERGFTLVEILLALALMILLLAGAYAALTLFQQVTLAGRADAERSQLARAIERRIASDIRCVLFYEQKQEETEEEQPAADVASVDETVGAADDPGATTGGASASPTSGSSSSGSGSPDETAVTVTTPADAYSTQSVGVFGDATTLVLHVSKPNLESSAPPQATVASWIAPTPPPGTSDLRSVSYFLAVAGAGGLQGAVGNTAAGGTALFAREQGVQGLARLEGDRLAIQQADQTGGLDLLAQNATVLAPEVTELRFRYFDGVAWVETWDSVAMNALPKAIEVTLRIDVDADEPRETSFLNPGPPPAASDLFRFVVALPLADPTLGMAL